MTTKLAAIVFFGVLAASCRRHEGDACDVFERTCASRDSLLVCEDRRFVKYSCAGPRGCITGSKHRFDSACDDHGANAGDRCDGSTAVICSPDHRAVFRCASHVWTLAESCPPDAACVEANAPAACAATH